MAFEGYAVDTAATSATEVLHEQPWDMDMQSDDQDGKQGSSQAGELGLLWPRQGAGRRVGRPEVGVLVHTLLVRDGAELVISVRA